MITRKGRGMVNPIGNDTRMFVLLPYTHDLFHLLNRFIFRMDIDGKVCLIVSRRHRHVEDPIIVLL